MRNRTRSLSLCIPLIAALGAGCSGEPARSSPDVRANQPAVAQPPPTKGAANAPKKPKIIGNMTGPSQLVE